MCPHRPKFPGSDVVDSDTVHVAVTPQVDATLGDAAALWGLPQARVWHTARIPRCGGHL